jgi:hypothetical protein
MCSVSGMSEVSARSQLKVMRCAKSRAVAEQQQACGDDIGRAGAAQESDVRVARFQDELQRRHLRELPQGRREAGDC